MRLILIGSLLQACRPRASIFSNVKKQVSAIQPIEHCVRENCELLQEVETAMVSSS